MVPTQHVGLGVARRLELDGVTHIGPAPHETIESAEIAESIRAALQSPLGYPPLSAATVPGDKVVVALDPSLTLRREIVAGLIRALEAAGVDRSLTTFLTCQESNETAAVFDDWASKNAISFQRHDPGDENSCALFGVSQAGHAMRLNRNLCDADIVLPVGVTHVSLTADGDDLKSSVIFPQFSDEETIAHHRCPEKSQPGAGRRECQQEIEESVWLLGVGLAVQIVPGIGGTVAAVLAGESTVVAEAAALNYREVWQQPVESTGDLVVVNITGPATEQSWENVASGLLAAEEVLEAGGAIAFHTQLAESPGRSLRRLSDNTDYVRRERTLERDVWADSRTALVLNRALQRGPVYLHSQLPGELVESFGLTPIASDAELQRLVKSYRRPLVLEDGHRLLPVLKRQSSSPSPPR